MAASTQRIASASPGFGLGLRTPHYTDYLTAPQPVDWLEIITDNYLVDGGKPLVVLDTLRRDYPMVMHGVAMSIGAAAGVDLAYLQQVKALAQRVQPLWVSDHLCWIGTAREQLHDLYPLAYTDEAARHVVTQIRRAQDVLQRRLVIENVSSYIDFKESAHSEWQFLSYIAQEADCLLLVDVNNIYVSSVNHGFAADDYLRGLPAHRVQQIHLAGHSDNGDHIIDTHDHPVAPPVWALYAQACALFGPVATMIERDDNIPALPTLLAELSQARQIAQSHGHQAAGTALATPHATASAGTAEIAAPLPMGLAGTQQRLARYILNPLAPSNDWADSLRAARGVDVGQRLGIYHHAYRSRLAQVLADSFAKTYLFMGSDLFDQEAMAFAVAHPPLQRSLNRYGAQFPPYLAERYPNNPELHELAQLDWDLRACFDGPDAPSLQVATAQADAQGNWLASSAPLHPSVRLRQTQTNVISVWKAIDAGQEVPPAVRNLQPTTLLVWRKDLQPHFQSLDLAQGQFVQRLADGQSINLACAAGLDADAPAQDAQQLGMWLRDWLEEGLLRAA